MKLSCGWSERTGRCLRLDCNRSGPCEGFEHQFGGRSIDVSTYTTPADEIVQTVVDFQGETMRHVMSTRERHVHEDLFTVCVEVELPDGCTEHV